MELKNVIEDRRSIRIFEGEEVSNEILMDAIKYGVMAPSAHNRQPWKVKILSKKEKDEIAELLYNKTCDIKGHTGPHTSNIIKEVPSMIMIFIDNDNKDDRDLEIMSIGAFIEHIILYLTDLGLGTLWIGNTNLISEEIKELLKTPYETVACIGVGKKGQDPHMRPRKKIEDIIIK